MNALIKNILKSIEKNGFEAYVVGGYVRDQYLGIESSDVDIITNALNKDLIKIFDNGIVSKMNYGSFRLKSSEYLFDITTYRKEAKYVQRRPTKIEYINNLMEDLNRRDFTINSLCMDSNGEIIDLLDGKKDIDNKLIRVIGKTKKKLLEDPLRILRAIRFATTLDFKLDNQIIKFINSHQSLVKELSYDRKKEELSKILSSKNATKGLTLLKELNLLKYLEIDYTNVVNVVDLCGMWSQLEVSEKYNFTKQEKTNISTIKNILNYGKIDREEVYKFGLYYSQVAASIMGIDILVVNAIYENLPIKNINEIDITTNEIITELNIKPSNIIKEIYNDLEKQILDNELLNEKAEIIKYIKRKW